jgi:alkanesulfonate monooxygenase SsuD/methylene tetrahydromethanopterin reductase-like flavin-dependent oxidoreductase (luciferase family)
MPMPFRFEVRYDMRAPDFGARPVDLYQAALDQCEWADGLGFESCTLMEHHASTDGYLPSPLVMAAAVAGRTDNLLIRVALMLLPLYHPLRAAEDLAVLDLVSNGRLRLMVGAGYREEEYSQFGLALKSRPALMEHAIATLKQAWTGEAFEYNGETVRILPRPMQRPRPEIVMGGSSAAAAARAARIADGYAPTDHDSFESYRAALAELGQVVPPPMAPPTESRPMFVHIAEDPDDAWHTVAPHALHENNEYARWGRGQMKPFVERTSPDELRATGMYQILTPEQTIEYVRRNGGIVLKPLMGGLDPAFAWKSLELFQREVLPRLGP